MDTMKIQASALKDFFIAEFEKKNFTNLSEFRKQAIAHFDRMGFPTTKHEEWKYTSLSALSKLAFEQKAASLSKEQINSCLFPDQDANQLVFINGIYSPQHSHLQTASDAFSILPLKEALESEKEAILQFLYTLDDTQKEAFTALNAAMAEEGVLVKVKENHIAEKPLMIYYMLDQQQHNSSAQIKNLFLIGKNAQLSIVEKYDSFGVQAGFSNIHTEIFLEAGGHVKHCKIQNEQNTSYQINQTFVKQQENSVYTNTTLSLDGKLVRNNLNIQLDGQHCEANMYGLYMLKGNTLVDNHTVVDHQQPNSLSNELYKGILDEKSTGVFNGKIFVRQIAQKTNAYQQNRNILLSNDASVNTKPQLEIWADDVKCSHGATTGSIDKDALFYLRARGVSETEARALLIYAFANDVLEKLDQGNLKDYTEQILLQRLGFEDRVS